MAQELQNEPLFNLYSARLKIEKLVRSRAIENWESQDAPEHVHTIRDRLLHSERGAGRLLGLYQQILSGEVVRVKDLPKHLELLFSSPVINQQGQESHREA